MDRYVPIYPGAVPPHPWVDTQTGHRVHADECWGDDTFPDQCVCGLEQSEVDAVFLAMEQAQS